MNDDTYTEQRQAWLARQRERRIEPGPEQHVLTRAQYTPSYKTDVGKRIRAELRKLKAAA